MPSSLPPKSKFGYLVSILLKSWPCCQPLCWQRLLVWPTLNSPYELSICLFGEHIAIYIYIYIFPGALLFVRKKSIHVIDVFLGYRNLVRSFGQHSYEYGEEGSDPEKPLSWGLSSRLWNQWKRGYPATLRWLNNADIVLKFGLEDLQLLRSQTGVTGKGGWRAEKLEFYTRLKYGKQVRGKRRVSDGTW